MLQKDLISFALYNCNWTEMNMEFKKLLLLTMQINDADNLKLKGTMKYQINMRLLTNVRTTNN